MDPYGNAANQYGQEMQMGVRLADAIGQRQAELPNQLFDRFMQAYQNQIKQKMLEQQMARQQQHEDTYMRMAQTRQDRADDQAKADFANWVSKNYREGRDDGVAVLLGKAAGFDENAVKSMLPKGKWGQAGGGETISEPGVEAVAGEMPTPHVAGQEDAAIPPIPTGERAPLNITMPQTPATYQPGMGQGVAYQEGEQARKQADMDRKVKHDTWKQAVEEAKASILRRATDSKIGLDSARVQLINDQATALQKRIDSGEFDLKDDLLRAQIANLNSLVGNRGVEKATDSLSQELKLDRIANNAVPKDAFGNRDPAKVAAAKESARNRLLGAGKPKVSSAPPVDKLKEGVNTTFANGETWTLKNGVPARVGG